MQIQIDIAFEQLVQLVKALPMDKLKQLKDEIDNKPNKIMPVNNLRDILLKGPIATEKQIENIVKNRNDINQWRMK